VHPLGSPGWLAVAVVALAGCRDATTPPDCGGLAAAATEARPGDAAARRPAPEAAAAGAPAAPGSSSAAGVAASGVAASGVAPSAAGSGAAAGSPPEVIRVRVPGDLPASVVASADGAPPRIVFLPGVCSNAYAYLLGFPGAARAHGGVVALDGDEPCGTDPNFRTFTSNPDLQHRRIESALAAAGEREIPAEGLTLIGYSRGATIAEKLAARWPERYTRIVLIGSPVDPSPTLVSKTRAVATMSCSLDVPPRMKEGARRIDKSGVPATYFEMPGCTHGNITDGERIFTETLDWLAAHQRPAVVAAAPVPISGALD
jgi:pimeloyl-ACP methyl ester carboxylesterase